jgi:hypothetical protein
MLEDFLCYNTNFKMDRENSLTLLWPEIRPQLEPPTDCATGPGKTIEMKITLSTAE